MISGRSVAVEYCCLGADVDRVAEDDEDDEEEKEEAEEGRVVGVCVDEDEEEP